MEAVELPDMWYQGKAEISTYKLQQNRYNDVHLGKMTTIFVTEDFLTDKQVKNDSGKSANSANVLKMNKIRRFTTGIYDYSLFTSTFTDVKQAKTYKATASSQDWCGQSYMQINRDKSKYQVQLQSYFEGESLDKKVKADVLEDELPTLIRLDDSRLPIGSFQILPSLEYTMLRHLPYKPVEAVGKLDSADVGEYGWAETIMVYNVTIPTYDKSVTFYYSNDDDRQILQWEEEYPSAFDGKKRLTRASLMHTEWLPYWSLNNKSDAAKRSSLGLRNF